MYGKILIRCDLEVRTGMHIGGSSAFSAIGAVDSPVVRDPYTGLSHRTRQQSERQTAHPAGPQHLSGY